MSAKNMQLFTNSLIFHWTECGQESTGTAAQSLLLQLQEVRPGASQPGVLLSTVTGKAVPAVQICAG